MMTKHILTALLFTIPNIFALYGPNSGVVDLTPSNFAALVQNGGNGGGIWIVEFFVPQCGPCQQLVPEYQKAALALKGIINVGAVNCDQV